MADGIIVEERPTRDAGLLDRERTVARPGFNRWLVPPAALGDSSLHRHGLWLLGVLAAADAHDRRRQIGRAAGRHRPADDAVHHRLRLAGFGRHRSLHLVLHLPRLLSRDLGRLARAGRAASRGRLCGAVLVRRPDDLGARRLHAPALDDVARVGRAGRHRPRARLHLAGVDIDQVVPGPARHGDRDGDHGVRRRRADRVAAGGSADEPVRRRGRVARGVADAAGDGRDLPRVHAVGRVRLSRAAGQLGPGGLDAAGRQVGHDHPPQRALAGRAQDAAVLADLGGAVPQRVGRHRRAGGRVADAAGDVRRQLDRRAGHAVRGAQSGPGAAGRPPSRPGSSGC